MVISSKAEAESVTDVSLQLHENGEGCRGEREQRWATVFLLNKVGMEGKHHEHAAGCSCRNPGLDSVLPHPATALNANTWEFWGIARARDRFQQPLQDLTAESSLSPQRPQTLSQQDLSHQTLADACMQRLVSSRLWEKHEATLPSCFSS